MAQSPGGFGEDGSASKPNPIGKSVAISLHIRHHRPKFCIDIDDTTRAEWLDRQ